MSVQALAVGAATGFLGAIPPGPASVAVADHASSGRARRALAVGLGAALIDSLLCAAISAGAGSTLARWTEPARVRAALSLAYAAVGAAVIAQSLRARRRDGAGARAAGRSAGGFAQGVVSGIANPSLFANWTMVIAGLCAAGLLPRGALAGLAFAAGVGLGVGCWFSTLARVVERARGERLSRWLRRSGALVGALLLLGGLAGAARALLEGASAGAPLPPAGGAASAAVPR